MPFIGLLPILRPFHKVMINRTKMQIASGYFDGLKLDVCLFLYMFGVYSNSLEEIYP